MWPRTSEIVRNACVTGDIAPRPDRDLVSRQGAVGEHPEHLAGSALVHPEPLVDQRGTWSVIGFTVARKDDAGRELASGPHRFHVAISARGRCESAPPSSGLETSGFDEMCASR